MEILGVRVDLIRSQEIPSIIDGFFRNGKQNMIATPNAEMLVHAHQHPEFRALLNSADINVCDSMGVLLASWFFGNPIPERITGTDLVPMLCQAAVTQGKRVYFVGGLAGSAESAAKKMQQQFLGLDTAFDGTWEINATTVDRINAAAPAILIVAFGHGKQEQWIREYISQMPSIKIAIGVGGALEYHAGTIARAPRFLRRIGFEWLWRLLREPKRFSRILTAVFVFPFLVLTKKV